MKYSEAQIKDLLNEIILNIYKKNDIILLDLWDREGEHKYIDSLHVQYEKILVDFNTIFPEGNASIKILEISSFLGVLDVALAKLGFDVHSYDIPEFQNNKNMHQLYTTYNIHPSSGYIKNIWKTGLPYPDDYFDAVIMSEVLEHLNVNPLPILQEINRIIKKDGIFYITTPNQVNLANRITAMLGRSIRNSVDDSVTQLDQTKKTICGIHWREYTVEELENLLDITGFSINSFSFSHCPNKKTTLSPLNKIFYSIIRTFCIINPHLDNTITIIGKKKKYKPLKFWFYDEYIKYYPTKKGT